ncbi:hypothetical protein K1X76_06515 [bacterium]|nr:hypothetical protein [bacterium]
MLKKILVTLGILISLIIATTILFKGYIVYLSFTTKDILLSVSDQQWIDQLKNEASQQPDGVNIYDFINSLEFSDLDNETIEIILDSIENKLATNSDTQNNNNDYDSVDINSITAQEKLILQNFLKTHQLILNEWESLAKNSTLFYAPQKNDLCETIKENVAAPVHKAIDLKNLLLLKITDAYLKQNLNEAILYVDLLTKLGLALQTKPFSLISYLIAQESLQDSYKLNILFKRQTFAIAPNTTESANQLRQAISMDFLFAYCEISTLLSKKKTQYKEVTQFAHLFLPKQTTNIILEYYKPLIDNDFAGSMCLAKDIVYPKFNPPAKMNLKKPWVYLTTNFVGRQLASMLIQSKNHDNAYKEYCSTAWLEHTLKP